MFITKVPKIVFLPSHEYERLRDINCKGSHTYCLSKTNLDVVVSINVNISVSGPAIILDRYKFGTETELSSAIRLRF